MELEALEELVLLSFFLFFFVEDVEASFSPTDWPGQAGGKIKKKKSPDSFLDQFLIRPQGRHHLVDRTAKETNATAFCFFLFILTNHYLNRLPSTSSTRRRPP